MIWPHIKEDFKKELKEHTLDSIYFLIVVSQKFSNKVKIKKLIGTTVILAEENLQDICDKLMVRFYVFRILNIQYKRFNEVKKTVITF